MMQKKTMCVTYRTDNAEDTAKTAEQLGALLTGGNLICLKGELGAGKTKFTQGLARGLNIEGYVTSPTFTIVNEYSGNPGMYHYDFYRLGSIEELYDTGFDEYIYGNDITVIEWADRFELGFSEYIGVTIDYCVESNPDGRKISICFTDMYSEAGVLFKKRIEQMGVDIIEDTCG